MIGRRQLVVTNCIDSNATRLEHHKQPAQNNDVHSPTTPWLCRKGPHKAVTLLDEHPMQMRGPGLTLSTRINHNSPGPHNACLVPGACFPHTPKDDPFHPRTRLSPQRRACHK